MASKTDNLVKLEARNMKKIADENLDNVSVSVKEWAVKLNNWFGKD